MAARVQSPQSPPEPYKFVCNLYDFLYSKDFQYIIKKYKYYGKMSEGFKVSVSKIDVDSFIYRGFESHSFRQKRIQD